MDGRYDRPRDRNDVVTLPRFSVVRLWSEYHKSEIASSSSYCAY
jgi:hypothetical protein